METKVKNEKTQVNYKRSEHCELFALVRDNNKNVRIVMGENLISNAKFKTYKQADEYIKQKPYEILVNMNVTILKHMLNENKEKKSNQDAEQN